MPRLSDYHKRILEQLLSGWVLREMPDGSLTMRRFLFTMRRRHGTKPHYLERRIKPETAIVLMKRGLLVFKDSAEDPKRLVPTMNKTELRKLKTKKQTGKGKYER